ncbi:PREDICTED: protein starmaker-like [Ipomoea nil]|uniref:protein starmaker-like n=1 Tax=Ipomoea nil TaxID=35883 RepID=UPI0009012E1F|nr:PREDICTED: protein starmaker-like [Ipomoea nil]
MKEFRYALLLSKVKTKLEKTHQNDPACNVSGFKDDEGKEIADEDGRLTTEHDTSEDNSEADESPNNDENDDGYDKNDEDANDEDNDDEEESNNEEDDDMKDDDDEHDDDDSGNDDDDDGNLGYNSESPIIGNTEYVPDRSPAPRSSPPKDNSAHDPSHSMPPPRQSEAVANQARDDKMEASPGDESLETSPPEMPFEHRSSLQKRMLLFPERSPTLDHLDPENIMHQMLNTQPSLSTADFQEKITQDLHRQNDLRDKIAKEQHALKLSQFALKERVDLACTKYQLTMLEYVKDVLNAVNTLTRFSASPCVDAKKGEKNRKDDDKDEDRNRSPPNLGSGKRFDGYNIPVWMKKRDNYFRQVQHSQSNEEIKKANLELWNKQEEARLAREKELIERERVKDKIKDVTKVKKDAKSGVKYNAAFKIHAESGKRYTEGMHSFELIAWWNLGIIEG